MVLVRSNEIVHHSLNILALGALLWIIYFIITQCNSEERGRMTVLASLIIFTVVFWALFEQSAASMTLYADRVVDRTFLDANFIIGDEIWLYGLGVFLIVLPFMTLVFGKKKYVAYNSSEKTVVNVLFGIVSVAVLAVGVRLLMFAFEVSTSEGIPVVWEATAVMVGSLNAFFIFMLAPVFAWMWTYLSKKKMEPNTPVKFALGILQAGLGFGALVYGASHPDAAGKVSLIWLVLAYLLHTMGELCLSPVGLSAVTKLSVPKVVGFMMGVWFLATAYSEFVAAQLAKIAAVDTEGGVVTDIAAALGIYTDFFTKLMWVGVGISVILFALYPIMKKGMHGVK